MRGISRLSMSVVAAFSCDISCAIRLSGLFSKSFFIFMASGRYLFISRSGFGSSRFGFLNFLASSIVDSDGGIICTGYDDNFRIKSFIIVRALAILGSVGIFLTVL